MAQGIQAQVNTVPAPAVEGDFASANPRASQLAGPGALVSGRNGCVVGRFAWFDSTRIDADGAPALINNFGSGPVAGFIHREQQGLNTTFLSNATMQVPPGFPITVMMAGDFWARNTGATTANPGMKAYANLADGTVTFGATGAPASASFTGAIAAATFAVTGSITNNVLNVTAVTSGTVVPGAAITGTGIAAGTTVVNQISGTAGGIGTYAVNPGNQTVASTAVSGTYGTLTVTAMTSGQIRVGSVVAGGTTSAGTVVTALGTGTGGTGTYFVNNTQTVASGALTSTTNVETKWIAMSSGLPNEIVKITSQAQG